MKTAIIFALSTLILGTLAGPVQNITTDIKSSIESFIDLILNGSGATDHNLKQITEALEGTFKRNKRDADAEKINYMEEANINFEGYLDQILFEEVWNSLDMKGRRLIRCILKVLKEFLKCAYDSEGKEEECAAKEWRKLDKCFHDGLTTEETA